VAELTQLELPFHRPADDARVGAWAAYVCPADIEHMRTAGFRTAIVRKVTLRHERIEQLTVLRPGRARAERIPAAWVRKVQSA